MDQIVSYLTPIYGKMVVATHALIGMLPEPLREPALKVVKSISPTTLVVILMFVYQMYQRLKPFPGEDDVDGPITPLLTKAQWDAMLVAERDHKIVASKESKDKESDAKPDGDGTLNSVLVVDFYATWCPPCRTAAPLYHALATNTKYASLRLRSDAQRPSVQFLKCNVDIGRDVAVACNVSSMPTFKVFKNGVEAASVQGWNESELCSHIDAALY